MIPAGPYHGILDNYKACHNKLYKAYISYEMLLMPF